MPHPSHKPLIEVCVDSVESIISALRGGAGRIELCSALSEGGLTPSIGLVHSALKLAEGLPIHVMIRPRMGDFLYTPEEQELMLLDIQALLELPIAGFVIGALTEHGELDIDFLQRVASLIQGRKTLNCHRAFDVCRDRELATRQLIKLGFQRILTSGGASSAIEGANTLASLIQHHGQDIIIMPGAGITPDNIKEVRMLTQAQEFHLSAKHAISSKMQYRHTGVSMGGGRVDEYTRYTTSEELLRYAVQALSAE